ncbi:MAG: GGDEF domain-containing protein, partial [Candidatus Limnocylindrales bacterium]
MSDSTGPASGPLAVLSAGAAALARAADLDTALAVIVEAGTAAAGAAMAAVFSQDPEIRGLELLLTLGMEEAATAAFEADVTGDPNHPIRRAALDRTGSLGRDGMTPDGQPLTVADLPLVVASSGGAEHCVGVLSFGWPGSHQVDTDQETLLVGIADMAAAAISAFRVASMVAERAEWFERITHTDALTGLANARTLARVLELEVARALRQGGEVSVAVFDIDAFTALNNAAGAQAGDTALRQVASVLAESVRLVDTIARTGADEFVLVAPGSAGVTVARRILDGIGRLEAVDGHTVTVSAGVARFPQDGDDAD